MILVDSSYNSGKNEVLFVKIGAMILDLQLDTSFASVRKRCGNPLGSAWQWQMNTISKNIINSSNDMKTQTSKCHTFSVLLFYQLSLYTHFSSEFFHSSYKLCNNFQKPLRSSICGHTRHQISEK